MAYSIAALRGTPDEKLIAEHDEIAGNTFVGTQYFEDELRRRDSKRANQASHRLAAESYALARQTLRLTVVGVVIAIIAVMVAVVALFVR